VSEGGEKEDFLPVSRNRMEYRGGGTCAGNQRAVIKCLCSKVG